MKALCQNIRKNGYDYTQILRGSRTCIYEQRLCGVLIAFEVFIIRVSPRRKIVDKWIEEKELFPHNEAFGKSAWSYSTLKRAKARYDQIENRTK